MGKSAYIDNSRSPCLLAFDRTYLLIAIFQDEHQAALMLGCDPGNINASLNGFFKSSVGYYWRRENITVSISVEDIGTLTIQEFDNMCGVESDVFKNGKMAKKRYSRTQVKKIIEDVEAKAREDIKKEQARKASQRAQYKYKNFNEGTNKRKNF